MLGLRSLPYKFPSRYDLDSNRYLVEPEKGEHETKLVSVDFGLASLISSFGWRVFSNQGVQLQRQDLLNLDEMSEFEENYIVETPDPRNRKCVLIEGTNMRKV